MKTPSPEKILKNFVVDPLLYPTRIFRKPKRAKTGLAPGSLIYTGQKYLEETLVEVIRYDNDDLHKVENPDLSNLRQYIVPDKITWINVVGLHEVEKISKIGQDFGLNNLLIEDILDVNQRPRLEEHEDFTSAVIKMIDYSEKTRQIELEQVSLIIHDQYVLCFQEKPGDIFDPVRSRLHHGQGKARKRRGDYLGYMIIDIIVDFYFEIMDTVYERIENLEKQVIRSPKRQHMMQILQLKKDVMFLRKLVTPLNPALKGLSIREDSLMTPDTQVFLRDTYDHLLSVMDNLDMYREMIMSLMDLYQSQLSNKMNEVMKMLTLIATIFIPLTFVAGVYGMNFEHMPELGWKWAYPEGFYSIIGVISLIMVIYMRYKRWL
jgi:magnesium transporter